MTTTIGGGALIIGDTLLGKPAVALLAHFLERLKMPKLSELSVSKCAPQHMANELKALSSQLRRVCWIHQNINAIDVDALAVLCNLATVDFRLCHLPAVLMDRLCETHPDRIMWPRLSYMTLDEAYIENVAETQSLREVARVRNAPAPADKDGKPRWSALWLNIEGDFNIPEEQLEEVFKLMEEGERVTVGS